MPGYNQVVLPYHFVKALMAGVKYGFPGKKLRVIGVTGTNGKTTTSFMIWKMLNEAGHKTGLMTTVAWGGVDGEKLNKQIEHMTTVESLELNRRIKEMLEAGAEFLVLEVTSHALVQFRTLGIPIEIAVMTNVTHEHLDYHKTFDNYVKAKTKLFKKAKFGVANIDDESYKKFAACCPTTSYGIRKNADLKAEKVKLSAEGVEYKCRDMEIKTKVPGEFNVYNSLAAVGVGLKLGLTPGQIERGIYALSEVEGRMNRLDFGQEYGVIVDFAHTPDAFEKVFSSVRGRSSTRGVSGKGGRIISLFGGAGRRDETTRALRGEIAGKNSDIVILTEDDSRDEDPLKIIEEFKQGVLEGGLTEDKIFIEPNRKKAIELAVSMAEPGDLVLLLGKGHEKTILRVDGPHKFEDIKVADKAIKAQLKK